MWSHPQAELSFTNPESLDWQEQNNPRLFAVHWHVPEDQAPAQPPTAPPVSASHTNIASACSAAQSNGSLWECRRAHAHIRSVLQRGEEPEDRHLLSCGPVAAAALFKIQHEPWSVSLSCRLMTEITLTCITQLKELFNFTAVLSVIWIFWAICLELSFTFVFSSQFKMNPAYTGGNVSWVLWLSLVLYVFI